MPYWRRRRLRRNRKHRLKQAHVWEERSLHPTTKSRFEVPASTNNPHTRFNIQLNFQMVDMRSVRVCARCGQESVDYKEPELSCEEYLVNKIMKA